MNTIQTTEIFDVWFDGLKDRVAKVRIDRAEDGNLGDCEPVGGGVSEMQIHVGASYRVYFKQVGMEVFILLAGGDKGTQAGGHQNRAGIGAKTRSMRHGKNQIA